MGRPSGYHDPHSGKWIETDDVHKPRSRRDADGVILEVYCAYDGWDWPCPAVIEKGPVDVVRP